MFLTLWRKRRTTYGLTTSICLSVRSSVHLSTSVSNYIVEAHCCARVGVNVGTHSLTTGSNGCYYFATMALNLIGKTNIAEDIVAQKRFRM